MANNNLSNNNFDKRVVNVCSTNNDKTSTRWSTHAKWIIFLLCLVIAVLIAWVLSNSISNGDNLLRAIENFSTILSIILSISSIAFAGYTSIETGRQYHDMAKAVTQIETSNNIMSKNYKDLIKHYHETVTHFSKQIANVYGNELRNQYPNSTTPTVHIDNTQQPHVTPSMSSFVGVNMNQNITPSDGAPTNEELLNERAVSKPKEQINEEQSSQLKMPHKASTSSENETDLKGIQPIQPTRQENEQEKLENDNKEEKVASHEDSIQENTMTATSTEEMEKSKQHQQP